MEKTFVVSILLLAVIASAEGTFTYNCMKCICQVEGCERQIGKCRWDVYSNSCGPYQIKSGYYTDCNAGGGGWQSCAKQMGCSERCVQSYMQRYGRRCPGPVTCEDYARIHNGGPNGCFNSNTLGYWQKVKRCCDGRGGC